MTSEFEFLEARLRRQLPELADAYGAAPGSEADRRSTPLLAEDASLLQLKEPLRRPDRIGPSRAVLSRVGMVAAAIAVLLVAVGVLTSVLGDQNNLATTDPADRTADDSAGAGAEQAKPELDVHVDAAPSQASPTTSAPAAAGADTTQQDESTVASETASGRGCIGNRVWEDLDGDGIQDLGEPGIVGVSVGLWNETGDRVDETVLINGYFSLCGPVGAYRVVVEVPDGFEVVAADQGSSDHKDSDADRSGSINVAVEQGRNRSRFDIGLTRVDGDVAPPPTTDAPVADTGSDSSDDVEETSSSTPEATADDQVVPPPNPQPIGSTSTSHNDDELAWGFWVETRNAYPDNGAKPKVDPGVETIFDNYSFAHVKANSLAGVNGDTSDRSYVVNVLKAAEQTNTVLDLQLGSSGEYGWNFNTGRGNFSLARWIDTVARFGASDRPSEAKPGTTIKGDPAAYAAIQRAIDKGTIRYIFLIDEPNHKRWSPQWNGGHGANASGSSNYVTNRMLDQMAAYTKGIWGANTKTIVRTAPTNLITGSRGGMYRFEHMTHAYLTISSTKWMAGGRKGPNKGLEWFLTEKNNHTDGVTNFTAFNATNLEMSLMVQAGFRSSGNPWTGESGFNSRWWQGAAKYPYEGKTGYVKTAPGEMDYWIKSMLSKRHPETGKLDPSGVRWIDDFSIFRADRIPTDAGRLPFSRYPHYRTFLDQLRSDLDAGRLDPIIGLPVGWQGDDR